ncbi:CAP domain-containing protein [Streptomyces sp. NBC_00435]
MGSRYPAPPSRVEARRKKTMRARIVLSVTAAAASVAVGVAVAASSGVDRTDQRADAAAGTTSATGSATPAATPGASASTDVIPSGTPGAGAATSPPPAASPTPSSSAPAKPAPKPSPRKGGGFGGSGVFGGSGAGRSGGSSGSGGSGGSGGSSVFGSGGAGGSGGSGTVNSNAESAVLALVNKERAAAGCGPVAMNAKLSTAARTYSDTMARSGVMSHTGPDGSSMTSRVEATGYKWSSLGENIARGQDDADSVMNSWMNSSGHRENILNCEYRDIGIGVHMGDGGPWWTQDFGTGK